jgi:hypothetical protein
VGTRQTRWIYFRKKTRATKVDGVYTGTIENGMDLSIGGMILGLFKRKNEVKKLFEIDT